ncbi:predicted protein [Postia placenta Mad-698-R]|uniref:Uncharacterized protein n=1 Tax=Postia placenta MAD-698-R-SB12 TaxID=670580 RepID=A0A1X6MIP2_9APHY|nr:hypothetical protein POSPLADRAFT_1050867 [Postia placenta MAD-698-R-SB12]EED85749.1 predicted protein [Postia placenta Mad-698-R]OSX56208.1 hypothetical protein POSPLADRAFT_1050867 [Postia placenta MAD-698-R-SB12]
MASFALQFHMFSGYCSLDVNLMLFLLSSFYTAEYLDASNGLEQCLQIQMPYTLGRLCSETFKRKEDVCAIQVSALIRRNSSSLLGISILQVCLCGDLPVLHCDTIAANMNSLASTDFLMAHSYFTTQSSMHVPPFRETHMNSATKGTQLAIAEGRKLFAFPVDLTQWVPDGLKRHIEARFERVKLLAAALGFGMYMVILRLQLLTTSARFAPSLPYGFVCSIHHWRVTEQTSSIMPSSRVYVLLVKMGRKCMDGDSKLGTAVLSIAVYRAVNNRACLEAGKGKETVRAIKRVSFLWYEFLHEWSPQVHLHTAESIPTWDTSRYHPSLERPGSGNSFTF